MANGHSLVAIFLIHNREEDRSSIYHSKLNGKLGHRSNSDHRDTKALLVDKALQTRVVLKATVDTHLKKDLKVELKVDLKEDTLLNNNAKAARLNSSKEASKHLLSNRHNQIHGITLDSAATTKALVRVDQ